MTAATRKEFGKLWKQGKLDQNHEGFKAYYEEFKKDIDAELAKEK